MLSAFSFILSWIRFLFVIFTILLISWLIFLVSCDFSLNFDSWLSLIFFSGFQSEWLFAQRNLASYFLNVLATFVRSSSTYTHSVQVCSGWFVSLAGDALEFLYFSLGLLVVSCSLVRFVRDLSFDFIQFVNSCANSSTVVWCAMSLQLLWMACIWPCWLSKVRVWLLSVCLSFGVVYPGCVLSMKVVDC